MTLASRTARLATASIVVLALGDFMVRINGLLWLGLPDLGTVPF